MSALLQALWDKEAVRVGLSVDRKVLRAAGRDFTLWIRPVDATFPNWRQVVPQDGQLVVLERRLFLDAATRALKVHRSSWSATPCLVLTESGPTLDAVLDRGSDQLPVPCGRIPVRDGALPKDEVVGLNARYLVDALTPLRAEAVQVRFRDPLSPLRLWCEGEPFQAVVMPLRVDGRGFRILDDESVVAVQSPVPVQPQPEEAETDEPEEPEEAAKGAISQGLPTP